MTDEQPRSTAATNLLALIKHEDPRDKPSVNAWAKRYGIVQSTINRILRGQDLTTAQLEKIVEALNRTGNWDLKAWQLLVPGFEPNNPPVLLEASAAERRLYASFKTSVREAAAVYQDGGHQGPTWHPPELVPKRRAGDK